MRQPLTHLVTADGEASAALIGSFITGLGRCSGVHFIYPMATCQPMISQLKWKVDGGTDAVTLLSNPADTGPETGKTSMKSAVCFSCSNIQWPCQHAPAWRTWALEKGGRGGEGQQRVQEIPLSERLDVP